MDKFLFYFRDLESPEIFLRWTYLWSVSSVLQRRVYYGDEKMPVFGNMFVIFVAEPGIGKSMAARQAGSGFLKSYTIADTKQIERDSGLPRLIPRISFSADSTSPQALIDQLSKSIRTYAGTIILPDGTRKKVPMSHNSMSMLLSEEITALFRRDMEDITTYLNQWWDSNDFEYNTLSRGLDSIKNVCVTFLGCTTPDSMKKLMATGLLDQGFTARAIMLYGPEKRHLKAEFKFDDEQKAAFEDVKLHLKKVLDLEGPCHFSKDAQAWFNDYYESKKLESEIINKDNPRMKHYRGRIKVHVIKTAMNLHYSESLEPEIPLRTVQEAISYLRNAEIDMPKALASNAKNPLHEIGMSIVEMCKIKGGMTKIQIMINFGAQIDTGKDLDSCLKYMEMINKLKTDTSGGKTIYKAVEE